MSLCATIVACSVGVVFPCLPVILVVVVIVGSILIVVCTVILVLPMVHILASVWNVAILVIGRRGFQCQTLVCYVYEPGIDLLVSLRCGIFENNCVPATLAILVISCQCWCYEGVCVSILSCVDHE